MNRPKIILLLIFVFVFAGAIIFTLFSFKNAVNPLDVATVQKNASAPSMTPPLSGSAFANAVSQNVLLPDSDATVDNVGIFSSGTVSSVPQGVVGKNIGIDNVRAATSSVSQIAVLSLPDVPDADLTIGTGNVSSTMAYVLFFDTNYKNIIFNSARFDAVLKDKNGIPLFIPALVEKAAADNNFKEIESSLLVQKDFANAEISFMRSIKVGGAAIAFNKEAIGTEELTVDLADQALAMASGTVSQKEFNDFYAAFSVTAAQANDQYVAAIQSVSFMPPASQKKTMIGSILSPFLTFFSPTAHAQVPFGGPVLTIIPNPILQGAYVTIGPPIATVVFVPWAFLASPLFFPMKSLAIGSWWLGLYIPGTQLIIMAGTSLPAVP